MNPDHSSTERKDDRDEVIDLRGCLRLFLRLFLLSGMAVVLGGLVLMIGPNLDLTLDRCGGELRKAKFKRSVADIYNIAVALECYRSVHGDYPEGEFAELEALIAPQYVQAVPLLDGWKRPFFYLGGRSRDGRRYYMLASLGCDGMVGAERSDPDEALWAQDLVMVDGRWRGDVVASSAPESSRGPPLCPEPVSSQPQQSGSAPKSP